MISKKSLIIFTSVLFVSLCSPIRTETTKTEYVTRAFLHGSLGMVAGFLIPMEFSKLKCFIGIFSGGVIAATEKKIDDFFEKRDRTVFESALVFEMALAGGVLGFVAGRSFGKCFDDAEDNVLIPLCAVTSFAGAAAGGFVADYAVEKDIYQELKKLIARKKKERE